ncbi:MAG: DUF58 domain-containing protein [Puniceicoccaceae bacterium]
MNQLEHGEWVTPWESTRLRPVGDSALGKFWAALLALVVPPKNHRTYPTGAGWMIILISMAVGGAAYNTSSNILFLALSTLLSSLLLSGFLSVLNFRGLEWRMVLPPRFEAGEEEELAVEMQNKKKYFPSFAVWFHLRSTSGGKGRLVLKGSLRPGERRRLVQRVTPVKRGSLKVELSGVESTFPFGFLRKRLGLRTEVEVLVWPKRIVQEHFLFRGFPRHRVGARVQSRGRGTDLRQIRTYRRGDPFQDIHWKATAKTGSLMVRETEQDGTAGFTLVIDPSVLLWSKEELFETFCSTVATLARVLFDRGDLLGYLIPGEEVEMIRDRSGLYRLLDRLAILQPSDRIPTRECFVPGEAIFFEKGGELGVYANCRRQQSVVA